MTETCSPQRMYLFAGGELPGRLTGSAGALLIRLVSSAAAVRSIQGSPKFGVLIE